MLSASLVLTDADRADLREGYFPDGGLSGFDVCSDEEACRVLFAVLHGSTISAAAKHAAIAPSTLRSWRKKDSVFDRAMSEACVITSDRVARALYHAAVYPDVKGNLNTGAAIFWLKNRSADDWTDVSPLGTVPAVVIPTTPERVSAVAKVLRDIEASTSKSEAEAHGKLQPKVISE